MSISLSKLDTIIFDLGNVIVDLHPQQVLDQFDRFSNNNSKRIPDLIRDTELLIEYEKGFMSTSEFIAATNQYLDSDIAEGDFRQAWNLMIGDIPKPRLQLLKDLMKSHQVLILSNTNEIHEVYFEEKIRQEQGVSGLDHYVHMPLYSHLIGLRKPEISIYQFVIDQYLQDPSKALFLDDKLENVEAAINSGMQSIQVKYPDQIFEILHK